jgi:hypothetical protein
MGFKITRVFSGGEQSRAGKEYGDYKGGKELFRTLDDDGNICYHALCDDDESAERFHDYSMADVGATCSEYRKDKEWKGFIS